MFFACMDIFACTLPSTSSMNHSMNHLVCAYRTFDTLITHRDSLQQYEQNGILPMVLVPLGVQTCHCWIRGALIGDTCTCPAKLW